MATKPADLLSRLKKKAPVQETTKAKKETMQPLVVPPNLRSKASDLCELGFIASGLDDVIKARKQEMSAELIRIWAQQSIANRIKPDNFKVVVPRDNTIVEDCCFNFVLSFRKDGIKTPKQDQLNGKTVEEVMIDTISGSGGPTVANAKCFVQEEIVVTETLEQRSLEELSAHDEGSVEQSAAQKIMAFLECRAPAARARLALITDEEVQACLYTKVVYTLKEGAAERLFTYCETEEQLLALLQWINVTPRYSLFTVGEADEKQVREERLAATTVRFLFGSKSASQLVEKLRLASDKVA